MPLFSCETNLILTWSANCVIASCIAGNQATPFAMTDTKRFGSGFNLILQKLLQQLSSGFKLTNN